MRVVAEGFGWWLNHIARLIIVRKPPQCHNYKKMTKKILISDESNYAEVSNNPKSRKSAQSSKRGKNLFYIVLKRARDRYNLQHDKSSCSLYGDCILDEIRETNGISEAMFKARFSEIVMDLMDRKSFHLKCDGLKLSPYVVATHLAAMPLAQRKEILANFDKLPERVLICQTPIFEEADLKDFDPYKVLSEDETASVAKEK